MLRRSLALGMTGAAGVLLGAHGALGQTTPESAKPADAIPTPSHPASTPLKHIVFILRENHSYDNYFGTYKGGNGDTVGSRCADEHPDPPHLRKSALVNVTNGTKGRCHYEEADIPNYFAYARNFALCDNYFADFRGPSYPNYFMIMAAETPVMDNPKRVNRGDYDLPTIADRLDEKGIRWRNYDGGIKLVTLFKKLLGPNIVSPEQLASDAAEGQLAPMTWITPHIRNSEHPPYSIREGENWTVNRINMLMQGPQWSTMAIFVIWDEWGGFWDHVDPPVVEKEPGTLFTPAIRYGYRIPALVISPFAKKGHVSHTLYSHASVLRTIERVFDVPPLNTWDAGANDMLDCFDFEQPPRAPLLLPEREA